MECAGREFSVDRALRLQEKRQFARAGCFDSTALALTPTCLVG
jgi:hypothetical protein